MAVRVVGVLEKSAIGQQKGIGWPVKENMPPMAGMAHGNSGMLIPVAALWKITGEDKYEKLAEQIWQYEEYLYDVRTIIGQMYGQGKKGWMISDRWPGVMAPEVCCSQD